MFKQTPKRRVLYVRRFTPVALALFGVFSLAAPLLQPSQTAYAVTTSTINFQARLQTSSGAIVPDGSYNIEFKLFDASSSSGSSQGSCSGDAHCLWVESRTSGDKVTVSNGYFSVQLGSVTSFGTSIDWSQKMWLTMNIGGTSSPSWDGEMDPRLQLTAAPYAFQAGKAATADQLSKTSGGNTSTLSIASPTGGAQTFVLQDQGGAGTYNLLVAPSGSDGYVKLQASTPVQQTGSLSIDGTVIAGTALQGTLVKSADGTGASSGITVRSGNSTSSGNTGAVTISSGNAISGNSGSISIDAGTASGTKGSITIGTTNAASVSIGNSSGTSTISGGTINIGTDNTAHTIGIGNTGATGTQAITIGGSGNTANTVSIEAGTGAGSIAIGNGATAHNVQIASGAAAQTVTVGSTDTSSALTLQAGSGNIAINTGASNSINMTGLVVLNTVSGTAGSTLLCKNASNQISSCTTAVTASLQAGYDNSTGGGTPEIKLDSTRGAVNIKDADTSIGATSTPTTSAPTTTTFTSDAATSHAVTMPATVNAGDLLIVLLTTDGNATITDPDGTGAGLSSNWTQQSTATSSTDVRGTVYTKYATGSEDGTTVDFVTSSGEQGAAQVYRIPAGQWYSYGDWSRAISVTSTDAGITTTPNPASLNPSTWDVENTLWMAYVAGSSASTVSAWPSSYPTGTSTFSNTGTAGASVASTYRGSAAASEDPGTFTVTSSASVVFTIAIRPAPEDASLLGLMSAASSGAANLFTFKSYGGDPFIGIGTASPSASLHVVMNDNNYLDGLRIENSNSGTAAQASLALISSSQSDYTITADNNGNFFVQDNKAGKTRLTIAGTSGNVYIDGGTNNASLLILSTKTTSGDPTGVNGGMYYNSSRSRFRCYESSAWADCLGAGGILASAEASSSQGSIGSTPTTLTSLSFSNVPMLTGHTYRITGQVNVQSSLADTVASLTVQESTIPLGLQTCSTNLKVATVDSTITCTFLYTSPNTNSLNMRLQLFRSGGSGALTATAGAFNPNRLWIEDIGVLP